MRSIIANRVIRSILLSAVFLQLGIWVRNFAILLYVTEQTNQDPVAVSLISVAEFAPIFVFSFIGGAFADRWRPKRTMVLCDLLSSASVFLVLLALTLGSWKAIFLATLVSSVLSQFSQPAGMKLFKLHVPEDRMQAGMSMYQTIQAIFMVLGPMLGTWVFFRFGIEAAIVIMGIGFLLSAVMLTFLPADRMEENLPKANLLADMKTGYRYVVSNRMFVYMGGFFLAAGLALGLINPLGIFLVTENLGLTEDHLQWLTAANGIGMFLGGMLVMGLSKKSKPQSLLVVGFTANAAAVAVLGAAKMLGLALAAQFLSGMMVPFIHIACNTLVIKHAEQAYVGRVTGILNPLFIGGMVLNMSLVGMLKSGLPLGAIFLMAAGLFLIGAVAALPLLRNRKLMRIETAQETFS
ncbi:MFS transporter [Cohnella caldifontis]|uniref:MFS transporter n=1 Tax=Cohnella caldifontis TaxID=3027471 RepID=UPI0023EAA02A|nr:MFS transporter [Cohnella sp. YIM B05605]